MATTKVLLNFPWTKGKDSDALCEKTSEKTKISDSVLKVAKKELREDKTTREQALDQMRDWLKKNYDVENVRTDDSFLLRFLRNKKFSLPMAQQQLLKYLNMRKVMGHLSFNLDFLSPGVRGLINNGYIMVSPIRDKLGRRTVLYFASKFRYSLNFRSINNFIFILRWFEWHRIHIRGPSESSLARIRISYGITRRTNYGTRSRW